MLLQYMPMSMGCRWFTFFDLNSKVGLNPDSLCPCEMGVYVHVCTAKVILSWLHIYVKKGCPIPTHTEWGKREQISHNQGLTLGPMGPMLHRRGSAPRHGYTSSTFFFIASSCLSWHWTSIHHIYSQLRITLPGTHALWDNQYQLKAHNSTTM